MTSTGEKVLHPLTRMRHIHANFSLVSIRHSEGRCDPTVGVGDVPGDGLVAHALDRVAEELVGRYDDGEGEEHEGGEHVVEPENGIVRRYLLTLHPRPERGQKIEHFPSLVRRHRTEPKRTNIHRHDTVPQVPQRSRKAKHAPRSSCFV